MREILFRGKRVDNGEWVEGHLIWCEDGRARILPSNTDIFCYEMDESIIQTVAHRVIPETVGQYTGLTDKNGAKIFEGDICRNNHNIYLIVWNMHGWQCKKIGSDFSLTLGCSFPLWQWDNCKENGYRTLEVIGNIHDNPELLEGVRNEVNNNESN